MLISEIPKTNSYNYCKGSKNYVLNYLHSLVIYNLKSIKIKINISKIYNNIYINNNLR